MPTRAPLSLFYSYAHKDELLREQLEIHLSLLRRQGLVSEWHDRKIAAGTERAQQIDEHLESASLILLLISPDFLASDYCCDIEMQRALERHEQGDARVIPIILRPCDWQDAPFAHLQASPHDGLAVTEWANLDAAFRDVARGIRTAIEQFPSTSAQPHLISSTSSVAPAKPSMRAPRSHATSIEQQNRERLIQRVRNDWIKGVFEKSLHNAALITLGLEESPEVVENPWRLVVQESEHTSTPLPAGTRITEVYDDAGGELLILGEPGAGKTTLLLELARGLLNRAEQEQDHPIPVVFNLSSWTRKRQPLAAWLIEEMETRYKVPRTVGSDWINANQILPLLDGLDEVDTTYRSACMQTINEYQQAHHLVPLVICCRINEYLSQANRLALYHAVTIQPLTTEQINEYFARIGEQVASLRVAFHCDPVLRELATTPLMLTILIMAYQDSSLEEIVGSVSAEVRQQQIFATYTQRMLRRRKVISRYSPQQTIHWLSYLARQMKQQSQTVFYLERMQPSWLLKKWQRQLYYGLIAGPICGLLVAFGNLDDNLPLFSLTVLMTVLLVGLLFGWLSEPETEKKGTKIFTRTWMRLRRSLATALENMLIIGVVAGLAYGISVALYSYLVDYPDLSFGNRMAFVLSYGLLTSITMGLPFGLAIRLERRIEPMETLSWSWAGIRRNIVKWLLIGIGIGLIVWLIANRPWTISSQLLWSASSLSYGLSTAFGLVFFITLVSGVMRGLSKRVLDAQHIVTPNQGTWRSAHYGVIMAIISGVISAVFCGALDFMACYVLFPNGSGVPTVSDYTRVRLMSHILLFYPKTWQEFWILYALFSGLTDGAILGMAAGLYCGGAAYMQHFVLRFLLWRARCVPFNYSRFLDYAAERILLRKVGGGYIFIHRLLLEYFASLERNS